jgi:peptidase E
VATKPIFLLADSQLLFWRDEEGKLFLERARIALEDEVPSQLRAAYLGASNGDAPEFYDLFVAAMNEIGIQNCRMIPSKPSVDDRLFLGRADLILLAGGDIERGWDTFQENGLQQKIMERYYAGALLIGISAGAVQLGLKGWNETKRTVFDTFRLVPFVVDAHDEPSWVRLGQIVAKAGEQARGFGIPSGGGAVYHADFSVEPVRHPLVEITQTEEGVRQALLFPGQTTEVERTEAPPPARPNYLEELERQGYINVQGEVLEPEAEAEPAGPNGGERPDEAEVTEPAAAGKSSDDDLVN